MLRFQTRLLPTQLTAKTPLAQQTRLHTLCRLAGSADTIPHAKRPLPRSLKTAVHLACRYKQTSSVDQTPSAKDAANEHTGIRLTTSPATAQRDTPATRWRIQSQTPFVRLGKVYGDLSKDKLTGFVVLTAMAGYAVAPGAAQVGTLLWTALGTTLCSASANSFNQWIEVPYDAQMSRTRNRPLARHALAPLHALAFGVGSGIIGVGSLWVFVNPITASLGLANIVLYAGVYTAMKRTSIANTWVGSLVGAIPPLMGWAAATGSLDAAAWVMGGIMFAWQFPHFNSLAYTLRADYSKAGYRMMSVTRPRLNARVALRYSLLMFPLSAMLTYLGVTDTWFLADSSIANGFMAYCAYAFWKQPDGKRSRRLFFSSLVHLPVLLTLIMVHKFIQDRKRSLKQKDA